MKPDVLNPGQGSDACSQRYFPFLSSCEHPAGCPESVYLPFRLTIRILISIFGIFQ